MSVKILILTGSEQSAHGVVEVGGEAGDVSLYELDPPGMDISHFGRQTLRVALIPPRLFAVTSI